MELETRPSVTKRSPESPSLSLRDGLVGAGVGEAMMGVAIAGYANTVGAALEDTGLRGACFLHHKWDVDGDRTFVLKVTMDCVRVYSRVNIGDTRVAVCVCFLHIEASFLPVDSRHTQCSCRLFVLRDRYASSAV